MSLPPVQLTTTQRLVASARRAGPGLIVYLMVPVLFLGGGVFVEGFTGASSIRALLVLAAILGIACIGQTLAIVSGGIDLSVPALIGMADVMATQLYGRSLPFGAVTAIVLTAALIVGALNGLLAKVLNTHSLIVTLAMSSLVFGSVLVLTRGDTGGRIPDWLTQFVSPAGSIGPVPIPGVVVLWAVLAAATVVFQYKTVIGRWVYAMGANPTAGRLALIPPVLLSMIVFALSALFAAVTGILLAGFSGGADPSVGDPYLFTTIAAVVIGGTSLIGGRGGYGRTIAGVLLITVLTTLLVGLGASDAIQQMLLGVLIVVMIAIYGRQRRVREEV
ncbi:ABC transporter permease [Parafrigoribacterium humi]|uniref:ABC transporter permease n=1 Tax=Parafrigoribacterium humi TaxID=3144664 RepID=UPI0032EC33DC